MIGMFTAWWLVVFGPQSAAANVDDEVTARDGSQGYAENEAAYLCAKSLNAQCRALGLEGASNPWISRPECEQDRDEVWTCTLHCEGTCDQPEPPATEQP